ncbi:unnamed protein product, partial [Cladocopium goreaui]
MWCRNVILWPGNSGIPPRFPGHPRLACESWWLSMWTGLTLTSCRCYWPLDGAAGPLSYS